MGKFVVTPLALVYPPARADTTTIRLLDAKTRPCPVEKQETPSTAPAHFQAKDSDGYTRPDLRQDRRHRAPTILFRIAIPYGRSA
jgi:hypothetical protein